MTISNEMYRDAGALGRIYRLLWWNRSKQKYVIPSFEVSEDIRLPYTATHPGTFVDICKARDFLLWLFPGVRVIIAPY